MPAKNKLLINIIFSNKYFSKVLTNVACFSSIVWKQIFSQKTV